MTTGGNTFNYLYENQLTKFNAVLTIKANRDQNSCEVKKLPPYGH